MGCVVIGARIYAVGGLHDKLEVTSNQTHVQVYDANTRTWSFAAPLPVGLGHIQPATCLAGDKILVAGGQEDGNGRADVDSPYLLRVRPAGEQVDRRSATLPDPRNSASLGYVNGKIIFYGGNTPTAPYLTNAVYVGY